MPDVAVVLGSYQSADHFEDCLASLERQTLRPAEVVVVDGGSSDGSVAVARALGARVIEAENRGLGYLYNTGVRATRSELVFVGNTDIALGDSCLAELASALEADGSRFAADPCQLDWPGGTVIHARVLARRAKLLRTPIPGLALDPVVQAVTVTPTVAANAGAMLLRRDMFDALGGFDEGFYLEYEDLDLCWRAWLRGWESVYVPTAAIRHRVGGSTSSSARPRRLAASHVSVLRFALKCLPAGPAARVVAGELLRLPRHRRPIGAALGRVGHDLPAILRERRRARPTRALFDRLLALPD